MKGLNDEMIYLLPRWPVTLNDPPRVDRIRSWGLWPVTSFRRLPHQTRQGHDCLYSRCSVRIAGLFWLPYQWKMEGGPLTLPLAVRIPQAIQKWIYYRSFMNHTTTILGVAMTKEFIEDFKGRFTRKETP